MPELVAVLHSFVGLAAVLVGFASYLAPEQAALTALAATSRTRSRSSSGVLIGAITFTGSIIAFVKLRGTIGSQAAAPPGPSRLERDRRDREPSSSASCSCASPTPEVCAGSSR